MTPGNRKPWKWLQCLEEGDLEGCLARVILGVGYVFTFFWLAATVIILAISIWTLFFADPSMMSPDSLNRDSPIAERLANVGFVVFLVVFGVVWLFVVRHFKRKIDGPRS